MVPLVARSAFLRFLLFARIQLAPVYGDQPIDQSGNQCVVVLGYTETEDRIRAVDRVHHLVRSDIVHLHVTIQTAGKQPFTVICQLQAGDGFVVL
uniref:Putative secreted protein n=1 Tax=Anopheles triannulatus TaxID=58253 RepID=A0A2M4B5F5_9DIPT